MNINDYYDLKEFLRDYKPRLLKRKGTPEQIKKNGEFFILCCRIVPSMIEYIDELEKKPKELESKNKNLQNKINSAISIMQDGRCIWCDWD